MDLRLNNKNTVIDDDSYIKLFDPTVPSELDNYIREICKIDEEDENSN